ncbi:DUF2795 domain-containing protein [Okibacterium endophyticum]
MNDLPTAIQIQKFLKGVDYPASKQTIVDTAEKQGADDNVLSALRNIADKDYDAPTDVSKELGQ